VATTEVEDVDGGPPGGCWRLGPTAATTEVKDVDGGSSGGAAGKVRQRPPPKLNMSMAGPWGCWWQGLAAATTEVEDVNGGPLGVLVARSGSGHH
jgi:hypothetical protein